MTFKAMLEQIQDRECDFAFHEPPAMLSTDDGTYEWTCVKCGAATTYTVTNKAVYA